MIDHSNLWNCRHQRIFSFLSWRILHYKRWMQLLFVNTAPLELFNQLKTKSEFGDYYNSLVGRSLQFERGGIDSVKSGLAPPNTSLVKMIKSADMNRKIPPFFVVLSDHLGRKQLTQRTADFFSITPEYLYCLNSLRIHKLVEGKRGVQMIHAVKNCYQGMFTSCHCPMD